VTQRRHIAAMQLATTNEFRLYAIRGFFFMCTILYILSLGSTGK